MSSVTLCSNYNSSSNIYAVESSCDDSCVAVYRAGQFLFEKVDTQRDELSLGGVVPELAARKHSDSIPQSLREAFEVVPPESGKSGGQDYMAYTAGPGLSGPLAVGGIWAHLYAARYSLTLIPIDHLEAHLFSPLIGTSIEQIEFPFLALLVSGGHTLIVKVDGVGKGSFSIIATTMDDAAGEIIDKSARLIGLPYPGGPALEKLASRSSPETAIKFSTVKRGDELRLSFSGLKTEFKRKASLGIASDGQFLADLALGLHIAIADRLSAACKAALAAGGCRPRSLMLSGGVSANTIISEMIAASLSSVGCKVSRPLQKYCGDNASMVAYLASILLDSGRAEIRGINQGIGSYPTTGSPRIGEPL